MRAERARLNDILEAINRIRRHTPAEREDFDQDEVIQVWVLHHLQLIGEACAAVGEPLRATRPEVDWRGWVGLRNVLVHEYFGVELDPVWLAATSELEHLRVAVEEMLAVSESDE